jgi:hypothetical protein
MRFLTVITLIACLSTPLDGFLFDKPSPSPWFIEHVALQPFDLPPGVSIELGKSEVGIRPQEYIIIKNETSTALYVIGTAFDGEF